MLEATYQAEAGEDLTVFHHGQSYTFKAGTPLVIPESLATVLQSLTLESGLPAFTVVGYSPPEDEYTQEFSDYLTERYAGQIQQKLEEMQTRVVNRRRKRINAARREIKQRTLL
jgi:hypothetical protein